MASYGYTFSAGDTVTPTRLNSARTVSDIVNADIKSDAAIAGTKISPNFGAQNVVTTGNVSSGTTSTNFKLTATHSATDGAWLHGSGTSSYIGLGGFGGASQGAFRLNYERSTGLITFNGGTRDTPSALMAIDGFGNVGIGTNSPSSKVEIANSGTFALRAVNTGVAAVRLSVGTNSIYGLDTESTDLQFAIGGTERVRVKTTGQVRFQPLASDPAGAQSGDVYYNSATNKLRVHNGTSWVDLH